jgi:hypothetical protein
MPGLELDQRHAGDREVERVDGRQRFRLQSR